MQSSVFTVHRLPGYICNTCSHIYMPCATSTSNISNFIHAVSDCHGRLSPATTLHAYASCTAADHAHITLHKQCRVRILHAAQNSNLTGAACQCVQTYVHVPDRSASQCKPWAIPCATASRPHASLCALFGWDKQRIMHRSDAG